MATVHFGRSHSNDKVLRERVGMTATIDNRPIYDHAVGDGIAVRDKRMAIDC